jgi:hypothetical protein
MYIRVTAALAGRPGQRLAPSTSLDTAWARIRGRGPPSDSRSLLRYPGVQIFRAPATPQHGGIPPTAPRTARSAPAVFTEAIVPARCGPRQMPLRHAGPGNRHSAGPPFDSGLWPRLA